MKLEKAMNNRSNDVYFTRRATGYGEHGIITALKINYYVSLEIKI
ncbi:MULTISPECIES: hypothetical protein [unclassified Polaribacter]|nr:MULTISPECIES: hypothetical protein [unclassified Polaribacter]